MDPHRLIRQPPRQKRAAVHRAFEPILETGRRLQIQKQLNRLLLVPRELPHLQAARMRRRLPVHMPRAFERLIRPYAVEVPPQPAVMRLDLPRQVRQQLLEPRLRVDAWINHHLPPQHHPRRLLQKSERKPRVKREVVLPVFPAPRETDLHRLLQRRSARNHREVHRRLQHRRRILLLLHSHHVYGKRRHPELHIAHI